MNRKCKKRRQETEKRKETVEKNYASVLIGSGLISIMGHAKTSGKWGIGKLVLLRVHKQ